MTLADGWFIAIAVLFTGYLVLEGFDFGVGMLMSILGRRSDTRRRVLLNTIGPVWDGNEVWLLTAAGAMFAAFPDWYATIFSAFYFPLLLILVGLIVRVCAIEWRSKIESPQWRRAADIGIGLGSWIPAIGWGFAFANIVRGLPIDESKNLAAGSNTAGIGALLNGYSLLGAAATCLLFLLHGAVFVALKTDDEMRAHAGTLAARLAVPVTAVAAAFLLWTQLSHGHPWTWVAVGVGVLALFATAFAAARRAEGWAFAGSSLAITAVTVLLFGSLFPNVVPSTIDPAFNLTVANASSTHYTLTVMTWCTVVVLPVVIGYQAWTYWVFRQRISTTHIPTSIGLRPRPEKV